MRTRGQTADADERQMWVDGKTMSTHGQTTDADERQMVVEGKRDRLELAREAGWGGVSWRSVVAGVFVAYGVIGACIGIAAAVLHADRDSHSTTSPTTTGNGSGSSPGSLQQRCSSGHSRSADTPQVVWPVGPGLRNGVLVFVLGVVLLAVVATVAQLEGATSAIADRLESLGAPTDGTTWTASASRAARWRSAA